MIELTKLNGEDFLLNIDHIETIENTPDSVITTTNGKKILVKDATEDILKKIMDYKRDVFKEVKVVNK